MKSPNHGWTPAEEEKLKAMLSAGFTYHQIAIALGLTEAQVRYKNRNLKAALEVVQESPYPVYDEPLLMEGNAVVLPDVELPFHNAEFLNRVLQLAQRWNIRQCIVAGDLIHFDSLSAWEANWITSESDYQISVEQERKLMNFAMTLPDNRQEEMMQLVVELAGYEDGSRNLSRELTTVRREICNLSKVFDRIDFVIGNHDDRFLRAMKTSMFPEELLKMVEAPEAKWKIAPYYYSILVSSGEKFQIEHPRSAAKYAATKLASKYQCHILMAHSHAWSKMKDTSGKFWAIQMGCVVDERRLPYASQRHNTRDAHIPGAVIVKDGYPYLLGENDPVLEHPQVAE